MKLLIIILTFVSFSFIVLIAGLVLSGVVPHFRPAVVDDVGRRSRSVRDAVVSCRLCRLVSLLFGKTELLLHLLSGGGVFGQLKTAAPRHKGRPGLVVQQADQHHRHIVAAQAAHLTVGSQAPANIKLVVNILCVSEEEKI